MIDSRLSLTVLGCRGSIAVSGPAYAEFGGATSCYLVQAGEESVLLDAGSGLVHAPAAFAKPPTILLSHWHLDHVVGLGMYGRLARAGDVTYMYAPAASNSDAARMLDGIYAPPYWPLRCGDYPGDLRLRAMPTTLRLGDVFVEAQQGHHAGGCLVFKLTYHGSSIVYASDYEHEPCSFDRLTNFCRGASLVLYDGQYTREEYAIRKGYGHSIADKALELKDASGAEQVLIIHHDPHATDEMLRRRERALGSKGVRYAREGEVVVL